MAVYDEIVSRLTISPASRTANTTVNGTAVNLGAYGAESGILLILCGTITDGSWAFSVEESANGSTGWVAIGASRLSGAAPTVVAANDDTQFELGFTASLQYVRGVMVSTASTTGAVIGAAIVIGDVQTTPVSHA